MDQKKRATMSGEKAAAARPGWIETPRFRDNQRQQLDWPRSPGGAAAEAQWS